MSTPDWRLSFVCYFPSSGSPFSGFPSSKTPDFHITAVLPLGVDVNRT